MLSDLAGKQTDLIGYMKLAFANIAFGTIGVLSVFINQGIHTQAVVLLGYAVYLLQTVGLHGFLRRVYGVLCDSSTLLAVDFVLSGNYVR
jgi:hypothetical protein